jgi:hypothetical protein
MTTSRSGRQKKFKPNTPELDIMSQNSDLVNMPADPALLLLLLKAKSPRAIDSIFLDTFRSRFDGLGDEQKSAWVAALEITDAEAQSVRGFWLRFVQSNVCDQFGFFFVPQLFYAVDQLIRAFLYSGAADADAAAALFPSDFHSSLQQLITKILLARGDSWRESSAANQISAPRLVDFGMLLSCRFHLSPRLFFPTTRFVHARLARRHQDLLQFTLPYVCSHCARRHEGLMHPIYFALVLYFSTLTLSRCKTRPHTLESFPTSGMFSSNSAKKRCTRCWMASTRFATN